MSPLSQEKAIGSSWKGLIWLKEVRLPFLVVTVIPLVFGTVLAMPHTPIDLLNFFLALLCASSVHLGANVINDYFDHKGGTDPANGDYVRGFTGGSRVIQDGLLTPEEVLRGGMALLILGGILIFYFTWILGIKALLMGALALLASVVYNLFLHPLFIGELVVGFCFGTLISAGSFFLQMGFVSPHLCFSSVPLSIGVFLILFVNEIPDYKADKINGKKTLVVRMGRKGASLFYGILLALNYFYTAGLAWRLQMPLLYISFCSFPLALISFRKLTRNHGEPSRLRFSVVSTILLFILNGLVLIAAFYCEET